MLLVSNNKVLTKNNLVCKRWLGSSVDHLFVSCQFVIRKVRFYMGQFQTMVLKLEFRIRIGYLIVESKSDESAGIGRIGSETRIYSAEACL